MAAGGQKVRSLAETPDSPGHECGETERAVFRKESGEMGSVMLGIGWLVEL